MIEYKTNQKGIIMKKIEDYIKETESMPNISDGGSPAYCFQDDKVVLVKYSIPTKYGIAREKEELIAREANKKRKKGVNTPAHLQIKRTQENHINICWVLQEKAKGISFENYNAYQNEPQKQLELQKRLLNAPVAQYEKCIKDLCELFHMGLELKSKNIFYDETIGFTFIDLLEYDSTPLNPNSLKDILTLNQMASFLYNIPRISSYNDNCSQIELEQSEEIRNQMMMKTFLAIEKVIPNFQKHRRWVLRTFSKKEQSFLKQNNILTEDLTLNEEEYKQFNQTIQTIINNSIQKIASGKNEFWQIGANEIRIDLEENGLQSAWLYHKENTRSPQNFEDNYNYQDTCQNDLEYIVNEIFHKQLQKLAAQSTNPHIIEANQELEKRKNYHSKK